MSWIETYRGTVYRWEVDNVDHFTVAYYFARFEDATGALLEAIGLGRERLVATARAAAVAECRVRYLRELRVGDVLHIRSGVVDADGGGLVLGHEVLDSSDGARCTTVEQRVAVVDAASGAALALGAGDLETARGRRVDWDARPGRPSGAGRRRGLPRHHARQREALGARRARGGGSAGVHPPLLGGQRAAARRLRDDAGVHASGAARLLDLRV